MRKAVVITVVCIFVPLMMLAQTAEHRGTLGKDIEKFFAKYKPRSQTLVRQSRLIGFQVNDTTQTLVVTADEYFAEQEFSQETNTYIYKQLRKEISKPYNKYKLTIITNGLDIDELIPNRLSNRADPSRLWGSIGYDGEPWVTNASAPVTYSHGLQGRHIALWASHGCYYDQAKGMWKWQRPKLFGTTEDLFTQTIVVPYLIPMLENAGANVFTPRERDWQKNEVIVDNDNASGSSYIEVSAHGKWQDTGLPGFAFHAGQYNDGENPFTMGTARQTKTTSSKYRYSMVSYQPNIPQAGRYAVYVSYQTVPNSIDNAKYTVWHKGEKTEFHVNQQMGGSTWVYLGTFDFDAGSSEYNRVTVTNQSNHSGIVTTDAVRFGGGMGNIQRGGSVSGFPRSLEGARYYAQWAGMPYNIYSSKSGADDYADDINVRSLMTNYIGGGSCYMPTIDGRKVPIELSLAVHSDAGFAKDGAGLIGPLSICTTNHNNRLLDAGISRLASRDFADALLANEVIDLKYKYGQWNRRALYDRNYSETRLPAVPSAILETMSHQNFPDMVFGQDPNFRFTLARSIYKTILRYINDQHGTPFVVAPLTPSHFKVEFTGKNEIMLSWKPVDDPQESTSKPTGYVVYMAKGKGGYDNGTYVRSHHNYKMKLEPQTLYRFRVAAVNRGGQSFPSEELTALYHPAAQQTVLVVNGFHRLAAPAIRNTSTEQGFDMDEDPGITYGPTAGWVGRQIDFDRTRMGIEGEGGLGYSSDELAGTFVAGNDFNYVATHTEAIQTAQRYNVVSCSSEAVEAQDIKLSHYAMVDLILGLEKNDGHSLVAYKTFTPAMQQALQHYVSRGGSLLVSGAYVGSDMRTTTEQQFLASVLKCRPTGCYRQPNDTVFGMGTTMSFYHQLNEQHYAATSVDALQPVTPAYAALRYADGQDACIAYNGSDYRAFTIGFPFECIKSEKRRASVMRGILQFLLPNDTRKQ
ncbi:MAG: fibronectin type III domain-containing protein [Prevotella sp.]|nr:fibronectin type III domain-containing protein [Prevotella sp.]